MARESIPSVEVAPEPVDVAREERTFGWASLVRVVARVPLPIRAKQLFGSRRRRRPARPRRRPRSRRARPVELPRHGAEEAAAAGCLRAASPDGRDAAQTVARLPHAARLQREAIAIRRIGPPGFRSRLLPARVPLGFRISRSATSSAGSASTRAAETAWLTRVAPPHLPLTLKAVAPSLLRKLEAVGATAFGLPVGSHHVQQFPSSSASPPPPALRRAHDSPVRDPCRQMDGFVRGEARRPHAEDAGPRGRARREPTGARTTARGTS